MFMNHATFRLPSLAAMAAGIRDRAPETKDGNLDVEMKAALDELTALAKGRIDGFESKLEDLAKLVNRMQLGGKGLPPVGATGNPEAMAAEFKAVGDFVRSGNDTLLKEVHAKATSMSVGSDPGGGYWVTPEISAQMTQRLFDDGAMRKLARTVQMGAGDAFEEPDDRDEVGAEWVGEKQDRPDTETADIGMHRVSLDEIYALQKVTQRLIDDARFDVGGWVMGKIGDKFSRSEGTAFVTGNGIKKPKGLLTYPTSEANDFTRPAGTIQHFKSGGASGFAASNPADKLKALMWGLRAPYRSGASWIMNSNTASLIDQFKDGNDQYIWRTGMTAGAPNTLLGYPVEFDENMPDVGAGALPVAFGNFKLAYCIVEREGLKMLRDPYTSKGFVKFYAYRRTGGGVMLDDAVKLLKIAA